MKLRNKKTGEVWDIPKMRQPTLQEDDISFFAMLGTNGELFSYQSLAELNEEWEDYEPKEPLIKDEKVRKAVRAWAEVNEIEACLYDAENFSLNTDGYCISFKTGFAGKTKIYTIAELCGEGGE